MTAARTQSVRHRSRQARPPRRGRGQGRAALAGRAGSAADRAGGGAAAGAADRRACLQGRRRPGDADPVRRGDDAVALPFRPRAEFRSRRRTGSMRAWRRRSRPTPRGLRSSATIRCCCRAKILQKLRAPARPIRWPISRRWKRSSISTSTGTSSPIRAQSWAKQVFPDDRRGRGGGETCGRDLCRLARRPR